MKSIVGLTIAAVVVAGGVSIGIAAQRNDQAIADYKSAMERMHSSMMIDYTGDPDVDFVHRMIPHHQGAIDMAKVELAYGTDPEMRKLAQDVVAAQEKEIAEMKKWLASHGS